MSVCARVYVCVFVLARVCRNKAFGFILQPRVYKCQFFLQYTLSARTTGVIAHTFYLVQKILPAQLARQANAVTSKSTRRYTYLLNVTSYTL